MSPAETVVGRRLVAGVVVEIIRLCWPDGAVGYDVYVVGPTGSECITNDESFDHDPDDDEIARLLSHELAVPCSVHSAAGPRPGKAAPLGTGSSLFQVLVTVTDDGAIDVDWADSYDSSTDADGTISYTEPTGMPHSTLLDEVLGTGGSVDKLRRLADYIEGETDVSDTAAPERVQLTIEVVTVNNLHTRINGLELTALAAIAYEGPHRGLHFLVPVSGDGPAAHAVLLDLIEGSGFPYEVVTL